MQEMTLEKEQMERDIENRLKELQMKLNDEIEQKNCFQKAAKENEHIVKLLEEENEVFQQQLEDFENERAKMKVKLEEYKLKITEQEDEIDDAAQFKVKAEELIAGLEDNLTKAEIEKESIENDLQK